MFIRPLLIGSAAAIAAMAAPSLSYAHHSYAMFDPAVTYNLPGTIKQVQWTNPHSWVYIVVNSGEHKGEIWGFECSAPLLLVRKGWTPDMFKAGDNVTVATHPRKDGQKAGTLLTITMANGKLFDLRGAAGGQAALK